MARRPRPTRSEIRDRHARTPAARVYGLVVIDPHADVWRSNLAVYADSPEVADEHWHRLGLVRDYEELPHQQTDNDDFAIAKSRPGVVFLRRASYPGSEPWMALPDGYVWPHRAGVGSGHGWLSQELERHQVLRENHTHEGVNHLEPRSDEAGR